MPLARARWAISSPTARASAPRACEYGGAGGLAPPAYRMVCTSLSHLGSALALLAGRLARLAAHVLTEVADSLALVGLGRAQAADARCDLADQLLVRPANHDAVARFHAELDARRRLELDGVRVAHLNDDGVLELLGAVAGALDLQPLLEPGGHPGDHVGDQRAHQPVHGLVLQHVARALYPQHPVLAHHADTSGQRAL